MDGASTAKSEMSPADAKASEPTSTTLASEVSISEFITQVRSLVKYASHLYDPFKCMSYFK